MVAKEVYIGCDITKTSLPFGVVKRDSMVL